MEKLVRAGLRNPVLVSVKDKEGSTLATPSSLDNYYTIIEEPSQKLASLLAFVKKTKKCMVFFSTCACVEYFSTCLERLLKDRKIFSIHGKKGQKRHKVFEAFKQTDDGLLLCTGVFRNTNKVFPSKCFIIVQIGFSGKKLQKFTVKTVWKPRIFTFKNIS